MENELEVTVCAGGRKHFGETTLCTFQFLMVCWRTKNVTQPTAAVIFVDGISDFKF